MSSGYIDGGKRYRTEIEPSDLPEGHRQCEHQGCRRASLSKTAHFCSMHGGYFSNLSGLLRKYYVESFESNDPYSIENDLHLYNARIRAALDQIKFKDAEEIMEEARGLMGEIKASGKDGEVNYEAIAKLDKILQWDGEVSSVTADDWACVDNCESFRLRILDLHVKRQAVSANSIIGKHFVAVMGAILTAIEQRVQDAETRKSLGKAIYQLAGPLMIAADGSSELNEQAGLPPA